MPPAKAKKAARAETVPLVSSPFDQLTLSDLKKVSLELEAERARLARVRNQAQVDRVCMVVALCKVAGDFH